MDSGGDRRAKVRTGEMFCFTYAWQRRWRPGRPYRVIHLHWPRAGITACEEARRTLQAEQDRRGHE